MGRGKPSEEGHLPHFLDSVEAKKKLRDLAARVG